MAETWGWDVIREESTQARIAALVASSEHQPHGTRARYVGAKCRCRKCRIANSAYRVARDRALKSGAEMEVLVSSKDARAHLLKLSKKGVGYKAVADAASVSRSVIARVLWGLRLQIRKSTSDRILAVTKDAVADGARVPAGPTLAILKSLIEEGYTKTQLALWMGSKAKIPTLQICESRDSVTARTASNVERMAIMIRDGKLSRKR